MEDVENISERFIKFAYARIKVRQQHYNNRNAIVIYIKDVSKEVRAKLLLYKQRVKKYKAQQAESYKATINHEMRAPI